MNADAYSTAQGGLFSARFNNEFNLNGVQGTASRELITGLQTGNADLVNGAAEVLSANAADVRGNMLANGDTFTPVANGGIPTFIDTVHDAGVLFDDAVTKLLGGVYSGAQGNNQTSILNDLNATKTGLQNTITDQGLTGHALDDIQHVISLLEQESSLVGGINNTAAPTQVSAVNGQIGHIEAQILDIINHDATLAAMAVGPDGTAGFVALPPGTTSGHVNVATGHDVGHSGHGNVTITTGHDAGLPGHGNVATGHDVGISGHGNISTGHDMGLPGHGDVVALAALGHLWGH